MPAQVETSQIALKPSSMVRRHCDRLMMLSVMGIVLVFTGSLTIYLKHKLAFIDPSPFILSLIVFKAVIEIWCSVYAGYFIFLFLHYLATVKKYHASSQVDLTISETPGLAIVYLCCDDLDVNCLTSLCRTQSLGALKIIIHDDSQDPTEQQRVDRVTRDLRSQHAIDMEVLRRGNREGGKPGALNYILPKIDPCYEWMLICDNDSMVQDENWYLRVANDLSNPELGCVQFRNISEETDHAGRMQQNLNHSVDVFEVFVAPAGRFGWLPFFGHNGILRTDAIRKVGGFQPGEFADDIDVSIRLNLSGYKIKYRKDITFSEDHPDNYRAFRVRSYKWAYGCTSVFKRWAGRLFKSSELKLQQKFFFMVFIGFYFTQLALLCYLFITYILLPFLIPQYEFAPLYSFLGGSLVLLLMYLPTLAYFLGNDRLKQWPLFGATVGMVYGSIDFVSARALIDCFLKRKREWVPTNTVKSGGTIPLSSWMESLFGFSMLAVPYVLLPHLLYLPCSYLFALKFIVSPLLYAAYRKKPIPAPVLNNSAQTPGANQNRLDFVND